MSTLPQRVGNYQLERQIGKGGMSEVWVARHRSLENRLVAVKLLLSQDPEWIDRFTREANITSRLHHENIVQIYDHGYQHPYHYTIMEFVPGGALRELLKQGRLQLDPALRVFRSAGLALDYAHTHGVIHRDVSPGNILLEQNTERVLLTDFGIARESGKTGLTTVNKVMGTPGYLSPEHASSATSVTHLSDIYGLGVLLFEMLTGVRPWEHNPGMPDSSGGKFEPPPLLRSRGAGHLPPEVDRVIQTMLMIDPAKRYPSAQSAIEDLDQVLMRHTGPTQVVVPGAGSRADGAPAAKRALPPAPVVEMHPVEKVLGPDLLKGPMQEARRRAESLREPQEVAALLDRWSAEGLFRRRLLGRQAALQRVTSTNVFFYTLRVLYEAREPIKTVEEPDYKALAVTLEKEQDRWGVDLPTSKGFVNDTGGTATLPGSTQVINCEECKGIGRIMCQRCQGRARIIAVRDTRGAKAAGAAEPKAGAAVTTTAAPAAEGATLLIPCPDCSGKGGVPCDRCDSVGRLVRRKTTTWRRRVASLTSNDDLPRIDEQWLNRVCRTSEVYREEHKGGFRTEWQLVPQLAELIAQSQAGLDQDTRIAMSEVTITLIPVTEVVFDLGEVQGKGKPPTSADAGLYRWHIYGFENRLPKDWRFLNWARVGVLLLVIALVVVLALLVLLLVRL